MITTPFHKYPVLLVDDDSLTLEATRRFLEKNGYPVVTASSGEEAIELVKPKRSSFALALIDYRMKGRDGSETAKHLLSLSPEMYILIYSGDSSREALQSSWQAGAVGFIEKETSPQRLLETIELWMRKYHETLASLNPNEAHNEEMIELLGMVGRSAALKEAAAKVAKYRDSSQNVLITGETGTGKELVAQALAKAGTTFVAVSCAAYKGSSDLLESELFGYEKGAFTGADREKKGILEAASGGTVFLDEVHHLNFTAQAKLLRAFQEKKIRRVGGIKEYPVQFRLVSAAKPDLEKMVEAGEFLPDLYHRLNVLSINLPPLRERPEDIEPLVSYFCRKFCETSGISRTFRRSALKFLENYPWPGNVRELENTLYRILTDTSAEKIGPENLDAKFFASSPSQTFLSYDNIKSRLEQQERDYIRQVVENSETKFQAAKKLGISPTTLHSVMQRLGLYKANSASDNK
jgi:DNA-binding NtrC family response regulator